MQCWNIYTIICSIHLAQVHLVYRYFVLLACCHSWLPTHKHAYLRTQRNSRTIFQRIRNELLLDYQLPDVKMTGTSDIRHISWWDLKSDAYQKISLPPSVNISYCSKHTHRYTAFHIRFIADNCHLYISFSSPRVP